MIMVFQKDIEWENMMMHTFCRLTVTESLNFIFSKHDVSVNFAIKLAVISRKRKKETIRTF